MAVLSPTNTIGGTSTNESDSAVNTLKKGLHQVIITDKNRCLDTVENISIAQPDTIHIQINAYPAKYFGQNNGSAKASVTGGNGGYSYSWSEGTNTDSITNKTAGIYSLTVSDIKGCNKQASTIIYQSDSLMSKNNEVDSVRCVGEQNGRAIVHILGGKRPYTFAWNTSPIQTDSIAINLSANNYSVTSTDANGCKKIDTITISEPSKLQIDSINIDPIDCESSNGGRIEIKASGGNAGVQYSIGPLFQNSAIFTNIDRGIYTATTRDYKGCQDTKVFTILQGKPIQINFKTIDAACIGIDNGRAWIESITGGLSPFTMAWSNGQNTDTIQNIQGKQWIKIQIVDALNCQRTDSVYVGIQSNIIIQSTIKNVTCHGGGDGEIEVRASGGKSPIVINGSTIPKIPSLKT
ncbi:MAG: SprB repeat-containing protein [Bacteroidetes bacterium]|nr:SprB repeat-containing protein [Bacteroidota bacterium]